MNEREKLQNTTLLRFRRLVFVWQKINMAAQPPQQKFLFIPFLKFNKTRHFLSFSIPNDIMIKILCLIQKLLHYLAYVISPQKELFSGKTRLPN